MAEAIDLAGRARTLDPPGEPAPARVSLDSDAFTVTVGGEPRTASYRDLTEIAVDGATTVLSLGAGPGSERILLDQLGSGQQLLVHELRDRRLRQLARDSLVELPDEPPIDEVEFDDGTRRGPAQVAYHAWGLILAPIDARSPWIRARRSHLAAVRPNVTAGVVELDLAAGAGRADPITIRLLRLGAAARIHGDRIGELRASAAADATRIVGALIPDAPYAARREAGSILVDGAPATAADLPQSWTQLESAVLVDPTFTGTYRHLVAIAGGRADRRSIAIAPREPGGDEATMWFLVPISEDLVALELVSQGAHATYVYGARSSTDEAMSLISEALVESRFLREPMALSDEALARPENTRYRLAIATIPSLMAARQRFVGRIMHRDEASWASALDGLIAWHRTVSSGDDRVVWPGSEADDGEGVPPPSADPSSPG